MREPVWHPQEANAERCAGLVQAQRTPVILAQSRLPVSVEERMNVSRGKRRNIICRVLRWHNNAPAIGTGYCRPLIWKDGGSDVSRGRGWRINKTRWRCCERYIWGILEVRDEMEAESKAVPPCIPTWFS